jgi:O-methyltransferase involved in polyketide biosynthesis
MKDPEIMTVPNAARVYDYLLGGSHNFEPDRQAAEYMSGLVPSTGKWVRKLRRFLHQSVRQLAEEGFDRFLDLASGLPTKEHIHSTVPHARVVYVDNDPVVVAYGTQILGVNPNVRYLQADIRNLAVILESPVVRAMLGDARKVAIGLNAVTCFLTDDEIREIVQTLFGWAPPGSKMFASFETKALGLMTPKMQELVDMFDRMGSPYHFLTLDKSKALIKPWNEDERGFRPLSEWLSLEDQATEEDREGVGLEFYGAVLVK